MVTKSAQAGDLLERGVAEVIVKKDLAARLRSGKKLVCKLGIDPTGADVHIGHMVVIRKLRAFQQAGHDVVIIVGDYTARIGDPSGRDKMREPLTVEKIGANLKTFQQQIGKVLDVGKTRFAYQTEWYDKFGLADMLELAGLFTVQQMLERDMFQKRLKAERPIGIHEFMYPFLQGYDSVAVNADVEFGGTDQTFNLLAGRVVQQHFGQEPQAVLTVPLLEGLDGRKMSKSYGNYIGVFDAPKDMFGKVMSLKDDLIVRYFELTTDVPLVEVRKIAAGLKRGDNPRDAKARLAREMVTLYHDAAAAEAAEAEFNAVFRDKRAPSEMAEFVVRGGEPVMWIDVLVEAGVAASRGEARRLLVQVGKRKFFKIRVK